jgi:geranylgeranyl reductase family protein
MQAPDTYDVIIVGGGPSGSTAGHLLSRSGLKVLIIDKNNFPRKKLCGGLITYKTVRLIERVFGEGADSLKEKGIIDFESDRYEVLFRGESLALNSSDIPYYFVDRLLSDSFLLKKAQESGAEIIEGDGVVSCDLDLKELVISSGRKLRAEFLIGADGIHSLIRGEFPQDRFDVDAWKSELGMAIEIFVDRADISIEVNHPMVMFGFIDQGYAWIFPNREKIVLGICGPSQRNKNKFMTSFNDFLRSMGLDELIGIEVRGYPLPFGNFLERPVHGSIALTGDAAGFADPIFAEGIFYAQRSAELLSQAVIAAHKGGASLDTAYHRLLQKHILPELKAAKRNRWFFYNGPQRYYLKMLFNLFGKRSSETVHGIRSHRWFRKPEDETI